VTIDALADLVIVAIEELIPNRFELPGSTTLLKDARRDRAEVNPGLYPCVARALGDEECLIFLNVQAQTLVVRRKDL
jgi:hypothetical protein